MRPNEEIRKGEMMSKLKPCPFCGGKAVLTLSHCQDGTYVVGCVDCNCEMDYMETKEETIEAWNRRAK